MLDLAKTLKLSELESDIFEDIGVGICGLQTLRNGAMLITTKKKCKNYIDKTPIPKIINDILIPIFNEIREEKQWNNEKQFMSQGTKITLIQWFRDDSCLIKYNDEKEIRVNKKYLRELFSEKGYKEETKCLEYEQTKLIF